jgi:hypothetical protein
MAPPSVFTDGYGLAVVGVGITAVGGMGVYVGVMVGVMVGVAVGQPPPSARAGEEKSIAAHRPSRNKAKYLFIG